MQPVFNLCAGGFKQSCCTFILAGLDSCWWGLWRLRSSFSHKHGFEWGTLAEPSELPAEGQQHQPSMPCPWDPPKKWSWMADGTLGWCLPIHGWWSMVEKNDTLVTYFWRESRLSGPSWPGLCRSYPRHSDRGSMKGLSAACFSCSPVNPLKTIHP